MGVGRFLSRMIKDYVSNTDINTNNLVDIEFTNDDEWRILLECNVLVASAKPDKKQMQDLIALYDRMK